MESIEAMIRRLIREILNDPEGDVEVTPYNRGGNPIGEGTPVDECGIDRYGIEIGEFPYAGAHTAFAIGVEVTLLAEDTVKGILEHALAHARDDEAPDAFGKVLNFGQAVEALKKGFRVTRPGWNGRGMFLCYMPPVVIPAGMVNERTRQFIPEGDLNVGGYIVMFTAQGIWQPGWLASQADLLAEDWIVLP